MQAFSKAQSGVSLLKRGAVLLCLGLAACSSIPPIQEMSDARQALKAAHEAEADKYFAAALYCAERHMQIAEQSLAANPDDYSHARFNALAAKDSAILARQVAENLLSARKATQLAEQAGHAWLGTDELLGQAEDAMRQGDISGALKLAGQAREAGENGLFQAQMEEARYLIGQLEARTQDLTPDESAILRQAQEALARLDPSEARRLLDKLPEKFRTSP